MNTSIRPRTPAAETGLSTTELARLLSVPDMNRTISVSDEQVKTFVRERGFPTHQRDGQVFLDRGALPEFFAQFAASIGVSHRVHNVPENLRQWRSPWAETLVRMYEHTVAWPAALPAAQGEFLRTIVTNTNPQRVVEIGCFIGVSSIWMAAGLEELGGRGVIHSIDLFTDILPGPHVHYRYMRDPLNYARECVAAAGLSHRVTFHPANSTDLQALPAEVFAAPVDLLFIDGDHTIEGCFADFYLYHPYVPAGGYILLHDIYPETSGWDGPRWVIDHFIKDSPDFELVEIATTASSYDEHGRYGIALIRKLEAGKGTVQDQRQRLLGRMKKAARDALLHKAGRSIGLIRAKPQAGFRQTQHLLERVRQMAARLDSRSGAHG